MELKELLSLAAKEYYFIFNGKLYKQSMDSLWVHLYVRHWLILFLYTLKKIGYKIVHLTLTLNLITTAGMFMISLFCSPHQNI